MATCQDVVTRALRKLGKVGEGNPTPVAYQADNGLAVLQGLYDFWVGQGTFGTLTDYTATADYTAKEFERIASAGFTITFPTAISDENDRPPYDLSLVVVTGVGAVRKIYDAQEASWVSLDGLTWTGTAPLASRDIDGLACLVAVAYADEFGAEVGPLTMRRGAVFAGMIARKPLGRRTDAEAEYF